MNKEKHKILTIGSMNMDLIMYGIDGIPAFGETKVSEEYLYTPGGKGGNQAIAVSKLGGLSTMVGTVGNDSHGQDLVDNLLANSININNVIMSDKTQTGLATIMVDKKTAKYVSYMTMGGNDYITFAQIEKAIESEKPSLILIQLEMPLEVVFQTFDYASREGIKVFLDAGPAKKIELDRFKNIFVLSPNESECFALTGINVTDEVSALKAAQIIDEKCGPENVILKLGEQGVFLYNKEVSKLIPAFKVNAVDSTAAGDTFGAAFGVSYCAGNSIEDSILFGQAAAAICVSRNGAQTAIPDKKEVEEFLLERSIKIEI